MVQGSHQLYSSFVLFPEGMTAALPTELMYVALNDVAAAAWQASCTYL